VERSANPRYYGLIEEFGRLTGVPVLLNTSFNRTEPIVASPADAVSCYLRTGMDVLVMGDFYTADRTPGLPDRVAERREPSPSRDAPAPAEVALSARATPG
jgi:carbamoyltransferase